MKHKFICPLFRIEIRLYAGDKSKFKILDDSDNNYSAITSTITKNNDELDYFLVWVEKPDSYYDMVHETLHLTKRIFELVGVPFDKDNDEIIAYYQNYWVRTFWHKMSKNIKD